MPIIAVVVFLCILFFVTVGLLVSHFIISKTVDFQKDKEDYIENEDLSSTFATNKQVEFNSNDDYVVNDSCLSKIDKSISFCDFSMDLNGSDTTEDFEVLRKKQEKSYRREKQEG